MITISFAERGLKLQTAEDVEEICLELQDANYEVLILQGNTFGIEAAERLGIELSRASNLKEAHFKDLFTGRGKEEAPVALEFILNGIMNSGAQLIHLDLSDNAIGPVGAPPVLKFLQSPSAEKIEVLYVDNCGWGPDGSTSLSTVLSGLRNLRKFVCGRSRLEDEGSTAVSDSLLGMDKLTVLRLNQNGINVKGIKQVAKVIQANKETLTEIDLSDNTILPEGAAALANVLCNVTNLERLLLSDALLENEGFAAICDSLSISESLKKLKFISFEGNEIGGQKMVDLVLTTFQDCKKSLKISLLENDFSKQELIRLSCSSTEVLLDDEDDQDYADFNDDDNDETRVSDDNQDALNSFDNNVDRDFLVEALRDFIIETEKEPVNESRIDSAFRVIISSNLPDEAMIQVYGEELGIIKVEHNEKRGLKKRAIEYLAKQINRLPEKVKRFIEATEINFST